MNLSEVFTTNERQPKKVSDHQHWHYRHTNLPAGSADRYAI